MILATHPIKLGNPVAALLLVIVTLAGTIAPVRAAPPAYDSVYRHVSAVVLDIRLRDPDGLVDPAVAATMRQTMHDYLAHQLGTVRPDIAILDQETAARDDAATAGRLEIAININIREDRRDSGRPAVALVGIESVLRGVSAETASFGIWRGTKTAVFDHPNAREILRAVASEVKKQLRSDVVEAYERHPRDF